jgi:transcriptional regulator with XRE-family HTH domain
MYQRGGYRYKYAHLARDLRILPATISRWVNEKKVPDRDEIAKLAIHFGMTSRHIYGLLGQAPPDDLDDIGEQISAIVYRLNPKEKLKLKERLEREHGDKQK